MQGSGLGPLLFVLYINELAEILRMYGITVRLLADDLKMYAKILNRVDVEVLQTAVDRLVDWAESWQMKISITKCNYMIIGKQPPFISMSKLEIYVYHVTSCRDLGIQVCSSLSNSSHIANVVNVASQRCNLVMHSFITRDTDILKRAFITC